MHWKDRLLHAIRQRIAHVLLPVGGVALGEISVTAHAMSSFSAWPRCAVCVKLCCVVDGFFIGQGVMASAFYKYLQWNTVSHSLPHPSGRVRAGLACHLIADQPSRSTVLKPMWEVGRSLSAASRAEAR